MNVGVIYVAIGDEFIYEASTSAESVKENAGVDLPITVVTNRLISHPAFDQVIVVPQRNDHTHLQKAELIGMSPYNVTLFLDTDTYVADDLRELFDIARYFDIAAVHTPIRLTGPAADIPTAFPEFNTGILLFGEGFSVSTFCHHWGQLSRMYDLTDKDQPGFRILTYRSRLRLATLPSEYNCRFLLPGFLHDRARILHAHYPAEGFAIAASALNARATWRVHIDYKVFALSNNADGDMELIGEYPRYHPFAGVARRELK